MDGLIIRMTIESIQLKPAAVLHGWVVIIITILVCTRLDYVIRIIELNDILPQISRPCTFLSQPVLNMERTSRNEPIFVVFNISSYSIRTEVEMDGIVGWWIRLDWRCGQG